MRRLVLLALRVPLVAACAGSSVNPGSPMPPFALGRSRLHRLAVSLEASKGTH